MVAQKDDYHRFGIDDGLVNDKLRASATIWTKQDVLFEGEGGAVGEARERMVQTTVGRKQTEESKRGSKGKKNRVHKGSVAGRAGEIDMMIVTSSKKSRGNEAKEKRIKNNKRGGDGTDET